MYLKKIKRNGRLYLSIVRNYREGGRVRTKTVESLGYVDELAKRYDDPVAYFADRVRAMNEQQERGSRLKLSLDSRALIKMDGAGSVQLGSSIVLGYADMFEVGRYFSRRAGSAAGRSFELLTTARMLHAVPVHETWNSRGKFPRACDFGFSEVYRSFECFADFASDFVGWLNGRYEQMYGERELDQVRLVFSNYVFRWAPNASAGGPDEMGFAGEARLCLVIDGGGIPLDYRIVPAQMDAKRVTDFVSEVGREVRAKRVVLVAAQLPDAESIMDELMSQGNGFVLLQPAETLSAETLAWARDDADYRITRNGAYRIKSRTIDGRGDAGQTSIANDDSGEPVADRDDPEGVDGVRFGSGAGDAGACGVDDARRAVSRDGAARRREPLKEIVLAPVSNARQTFCVVSSEVESSDGSIFNIYRELWRVHEPFQVISADFISSPYSVDARTHLKAHFLVCYTAFFLLRVLRRDMGWRFNAAQVADALLAMEGAYLTENWYVFNYRTAVTDAIQLGAGLEVGKRFMSRDEIRHVPALVSKR